MKTEDNPMWVHRGVAAAGWMIVIALSLVLVREGKIRL